MEKNKKGFIPLQQRVIPKEPSFKSSSIFRKVYRNKQARFSLLFLFIVILMGVFAPLLSPKDPIEQVYTALLVEPGKEYWLGTDALGRDVFSRLLYGIRVTLKVSSLAVGITLIVGTTIGLVSAYVGGIVDNILM